jgi:hypothetical protein
MIQTKIIFAEAYEDALDKIEDFIFYSSQEIAVLEWFWNEQWGDHTPRRIKKCSTHEDTHSNWSQCFFIKDDHGIDNQHVNCANDIRKPHPVTSEKFSV